MGGMLWSTRVKTSVTIDETVLSADVDVTLRLTPDSPERFVGEMRVAGFELRVDDPEFVRRTRVLPFVHIASGMPLDVVLAGSGLEDEFLSRARLLDIAGLRVPTIDPEDLVIAKVLAGRPRDLGDARGLWRARGLEMDAARIAGRPATCQSRHACFRGNTKGN